MRGSFEIGRAKSRGWKNVGRRWTRGVRGLENWTIFKDVICVSSLISFSVVDFILRLNLIVKFEKCISEAGDNVISIIVSLLFLSSQSFLTCLLQLDLVYFTT